MRQRPKKPHTPKARRRKQAGIGKVYAIECPDCNRTYKLRMLHKPTFCIACGSDDIKTKPATFTPEENARMQADFIRFAARAVFGFFRGLLFNDYSPFPSPDFSEAPPPPRTRFSMSRVEAAGFIAKYANLDLSPNTYPFSAEDVNGSEDVRQRAYKRACFNLHPDRGGSHELFVKLTEAKAVLEVK